MWHGVAVATCLGIDIGGTSVKAGLVDEDGALIGDLVSTPLAGDPLAAIERAAELARDGQQVAAIGIGSPGYLDAARTTVTFAVNLGWRDMPLVAWAADALEAPVVLEGDAVAAAVGEARAGAGRGHRDVVMVTLGTGVGVGHVIDGQPMTGAHGLAGDAGHVPMPGVAAECPCGRVGCWELVASTAALERSVQAAGFASAREALADPGARPIIDAWAAAVGDGVALLAAILDPGVIVIGGAVSASAAAFLPQVRERVASIAPAVEVIPAALGASAGTVGAGLLARQSLRD